MLYVAHAPADQIVRACLDSGSTAALLLASDCADQAIILNAVLRDQIDMRLNEAFAHGTNPERRQILAGVLVTRDLRHRMRISDTAAVCRQPISNRIYALSCDRLPNGEDSVSERPVKGVWGRDALRFVRWANQVTNNGPSYRLPFSHEIERSAIQDVLKESRINNLWLAPSECNQPQLWIRPGTKHPYEISTEVVQKLVYRDFLYSQVTMIRLILLHSLPIISYAAPDDVKALLQELCNETGAGRILPDLDHALGLDRNIHTDLITRSNGHWNIFDHRTILDLEDICKALVRGNFLELENAIDSARRKYGFRISHNGTLSRKNDTLSADLMGRALSCGVSHVLDHGPREQNHGHRWESTLTRMFVSAFLAKTGIAPNECYIVPPESLGERIHNSCRAVAEQRNPSPGSWLRHVIDEFQETGQKMPTTFREITSVRASSVRLAALCLAAEAGFGPKYHQFKHSRIAQVQRSFFEIAAGVTLLELRQENSIQADEAIILACG